jgi:formylglycine-generating enzyme required for sulfatase activity
VGSGKIKGGNTGTADTNNTYNGSDPEYGAGRNVLASLTLTNGEVIWDMSGNVWEWTTYTINAQDEPNDGSLPSATGEWIEYSAITDLGTMKYNDLFLLSSNDYNADNGIGRVYSDAGDTGARTLLFGGSWSNGTNAGLMAVHLDYGSGSTLYSSGLRCVVVP